LGWTKVYLFWGKGLTLNLGFIRKGLFAERKKSRDPILLIPFHYILSPLPPTLPPQYDGNIPNDMKEDFL
jgi:hypothetical protein